MAKYRVWSGGNNTGGADNTNWAQAYTTLAGAAAAATAAGDFILVHYTSQENVGADTVATIADQVSVIAVDKDSSEAVTPMGTSGWVGTSSGAFQYRIGAAAQAQIYLNGITIRNGGASSDWIGIIANGTNGQADIVTDDCYLWLGTTNTGARIELGSSVADRSSHQVHRNLTLRFSNASQTILIDGTLNLWNTEISSAGTAPSGAVFTPRGGDPGGAILRAEGCDLTRATTLMGNFTVIAQEAYFIRCKLKSTVTVISTQTAGNRAGCRAWVIDCSDDAGTPNRGRWEYHDSIGSVVKEETIYYSTGATGWCWKVVTTSAASRVNPFFTPWIDFYNTGTSSITPRIEIFRDGSTTPYTDAQVWGVFTAKTTSGSDRATGYYSDGQDIGAFVAGTGASNQATGAGTSEWATGSGSDWSGKVDSGSPFSPAESGHIRGRIHVAGALTVYVDPQIRT